MNKARNIVISITYTRELIHLSTFALARNQMMHSKDLKGVLIAIGMT